MIAFRGWGRTAWFLPLLALLSWAPETRAEDKPSTRQARFVWDSKKKNLYVALSFRDIVDAGVERKLSRGLPTTIVFTATIYREGSTKPISTTAQTCRVTWHVWKEFYLVEVARPAHTRIEKTLNIAGVLRRCGGSRRTASLPAPARRGRREGTLWGPLVSGSQGAGEIRSAPSSSTRSAVG